MNRPQQHLPTNELDLVERIIARDASGMNGDDAAVVPVPGSAVVATVDASVMGVHFDSRLSPWQMGYRAAARALSDLAGMAATPRAVLSTLVLDDVHWPHADDITAGIAARAHECGAHVVGGDIASGSELVISVTCLGSADGYRTMHRHTAQAGDLLVLTGRIGAAALLPDDEVSQRYVMPPHRAPIARILAPHTHAAIDVSDGLVLDAQRLGTASRVGTTIHLDAIANPDAAARIRAATSGDDYELLCAIAPAHLDSARARVAAHDPLLQLTVVGVCTEEQQHVVLSEGAPAALAVPGWIHGAPALSPQPT